MSLNILLKTNQPAKCTCASVQGAGYFLGPTTGCGTRSTSLSALTNLFWQLSRDGNWHFSGMSHASTASPKPSFKAPWWLRDAAVGRGNAGWTTSKSGHLCLCQNCSQGPPAEKDLKRICAETSLMSPRRPNQSRDWTELNWRLCRLL